MSPIYILELESAKYYVGYNSIDAQLKMKNSWTSKYKPLKVVSAIHTNYNINIDDIVKNVMAKYGISSVRGGSYEDIDTYTYEELTYEIWGDRYNDLARSINNSANDLIMNDSDLEDSDEKSSYDDGYDSF
jgi:DNA helicase IV